MVLTKKFKLGINLNELEEEIKELEKESSQNPEKLHNYKKITRLLNKKVSAGKDEDVDYIG